MLVAGCAGFIGYHLAERLLNDGHAVVGVDNFASGNRRNIEDLQQHASFSFVHADICDVAAPGGALDVVYDLACPASPLDFDRKKLEILATCSRGVWNLLDIARTKSARFLQTSTSEVYGDPKEHPQREDYWGNVNPVGPRSCYDEGKRFAEALLVAYAQTHGVPVRIARIFNTYGPRMRADDGRALPNFISQALRNEPITVHGDGSQTRSFCYVTDMVEGLIRLARSEETRPVNLGNPDECTVLEVAREIIAMTNSRSEISFLPRPGDDPSLRRPDTRRAKESLQWVAAVDRATGLQRTIDWFRDGLNNTSA
ncbi:MAG: UDP-glucuronic acid decarboxylase family protein [Phycisphaerae bacterium]